MEVIFYTEKSIKATKRGFSVGNRNERKMKCLKGTTEDGHKHSIALISYNL